MFHSEDRITPENLRRLMRWFEREGRHDLPWRTDCTPYRVWVSEIMLQQTQVATVREYFSRFMSAFPDVSALAEAEEATVLRQWEGLGYYRRARQMYAAARFMAEHYDGKFPETFAQILALPGIGRYTAGAVLSFSRGQNLPILEANTQRLHARVLALDTPVTAAPAQKALWSLAESWVSPDLAQNSGTHAGPGAVNLALMDLGSLVCTPRDPACENCPLNDACKARIQNEVARIPVQNCKMAYENRTEAAVVIRRAPGSDEICLLRCAPDERWAGLWDFPRTVVPEGENALEVITRHAHAVTGLKIATPELLTKIRHGVTKYRILLECYAAAREPGGRMKSATPAGEPIRWVSLFALDPYPLSATGRKIVETLRKGV